MWCATIHSKSKSPSAKDFEFSTKRYAENVKTIKFALFAELTLSFPPIYVQALLKSYIKDLTLKMLSKNALVTQNSWNINDFVKYFRQDLRILFTIFFEAEN